MIDSVQAAFIKPLENAHEASQLKDVRARPANGTGDAAKQFESIFMSMVLKEMRKTAGEEGLFQGDASDIYGGMFDLFMAQHIADGSGLGLADMMERALQAKVTE